MGQIKKVLVYKFPVVDLLSVEHQTIYECWENTEEGQWVLQFADGPLEVKESEIIYSQDMGGSYPLKQYIEVYAKFKPHNYLIYNLKWAK